MHVAWEANLLADETHIDAIEEASDATLGAKVVLNFMRIERIVREGIHSFSWSEQLERAIFRGNQESVRLEADTAIALCEDGAAKNS